jgi:hypothetical protein
MFGKAIASYFPTPTIMKRADKQIKELSQE